MAVNFPDSPSNGDTFVVGSLTYTYTASTDVWDASGVTSAAIQISDTAPSNPSDGELWHNSSDLKLYIYYNDGSSSQWVVASPQQIGPAGPGGSFSGTVSQSIIPDTDSAYDLGSATNKFRSLYLSSDTLYLGDSASISAGSGGEIVLPSLKIGTGANAVKLEADASGKLKTKKIISGVTQAAEEPGKATVVTDMAGLIAVTGMSAGQTALVTALNKVFMYTGSAWFLIATMTNASPSAITGVDAAYGLATDGTATTITAVSTDPEGFPLTWSYAVTTGSLGSTATVSQADNVFTITPSTTEADAGTFSITFSVTDGATGAVQTVSAFSLSFGIDLSIVSYDNLNFSVSNELINPYAIAFNSDGTKMFTVGYNTNVGTPWPDEIRQYSLTTGFSLASGNVTYVTSHNVAAQDTFPQGIAFNSDGTKMFIVGFQNDKVYQYSMTTGFSLASGNVTYDNLNFSVQTQDNIPRDIAFNSDGTKMFILGDQRNKVFQYSLTTGFSLASGNVTYDNIDFSIATEDDTPVSIAFQPDGTKMFIVGMTNDKVHQYSLTTGFSIASGNVTYDNIDFSFANESTSPLGIAFNSDGTKMFLSTPTSVGTIYQYSIG